MKTSSNDTPHPVPWLWIEEALKGARQSTVLVALVATFVIGFAAQPAGAGTYLVKHKLGVKLKNNKYITRTLYGYKTWAKEKDFCMPDLPPDIKKGTGVLGAAGGTATFTSSRGPSVSSATANATYSIAPGAGLTYGGFVQVDGIATAVLCPPPALQSAYARAWSAISARIDVRKVGHVRWEPKASGTANGSTDSYKDPIVAIVRNYETGAVFQDTFLKIDGTVTNGSYSWDAGTLTNGGGDFIFRIVMNSPYTLQNGTLEIVASGGLVTASSSTGMFGGVPVPPIGSPSSFSIPLSSVIEFDYDVNPSGTGTDNLDVDLDLSGEGETAEQLVGPNLASIVFANPSSVPTTGDDPFHTAPNQPTLTQIVLTNYGNNSTPYNVSINYLNGSGWLQAHGQSFIPPHGTDVLQVMAIGPMQPGVYQAEIVVQYQNQLTRDDDEAENALDIVTIPVLLYDFPEFYVPQFRSLRTEKLRLNVSQAGRVGKGSDGHLFSYFADQSDYLLDGSLILGDAPTNLSWLFYEGSDAVSSLSNPFGPLYAKSNLTLDSLSNGSYRFAFGSGVNRDSTLGFDVRYYAPKHSDSSDFIIAHFAVYKGPNNPAGTVPGVTLAYGVDWDITSDDSAATNSAGADPTRNMIYQQGTASAPNSNRLAALAAFRDDGQDPSGGFVWDNATYVDPYGTYKNDLLWNKMQSGGYDATAAVKDLNSVIVIAKGQTIAPGDTVRFSVVLAGVNNGSLAELQSNIDRAKKFICSHIAPNLGFCSANPCKCGDADGNDIWTISDAVYLINYIFSGGPAPSPICHGDADGNNIVTISDAVYLINYIFSGGPAPDCGPVDKATTIGEVDNGSSLDRVELAIESSSASSYSNGIMTISLENPTPIAGIQLEFAADPNEEIRVEVTERAAGLQLYHGYVHGQYRIGLIDLNGLGVIAAGDGPVLLITKPESQLLELESAVVCDRQARTVITSIRQSTSVLPRLFALDQNVPNPFNPTTVIGYSLSSAQQVRLEIFNVLGQTVRLLVNELQPAGYQRVEWDSHDGSGRQVPSGVYLYRLQAGDLTATRKMLLLK